MTPPNSRLQRMYGTRSKWRTSLAADPSSRSSTPSARTAYVQIVYHKPVQLLACVAPAERCDRQAGAEMTESLNAPSQEQEIDQRLGVGRQVEDVRVPSRCQHDHVGGAFVNGPIVKPSGRGWMTPPAALRRRQKKRNAWRRSRVTPCFAAS